MATTTTQEPQQEGTSGSGMEDTPQSTTELLSSCIGNVPPAHHGFQKVSPQHFQPEQSPQQTTAQSHQMYLLQIPAQSTSQHPVSACTPTQLFRSYPTHSPPLPAGFTTSGSQMLQSNGIHDSHQIPHRQGIRPPASTEYATQVPIAHQGMCPMETMTSAHSSMSLIYPCSQPDSYLPTKISGNQNNAENQTNIGEQTNIHGNTVIVNQQKAPSQTQSIEIPFVFNNVQKQLQSIYQMQRGTIPFCLDDVRELDIEEFFVEMELVQEVKQPVEIIKRQLKRYTDLITLTDKKGKPLKHVHVLIRGQAATGKTTLISRLAYDWATLESAQASSSVDQNFQHPLQRYQLLFVLDVSKFKPGMDLVDALTDQLLQNISKADISNYLEMHGDTCLFLFDGYDELSSKTNVLSSKYLCTCHAIVTSRPHKVTEFCSQNKGYIQVELTGFTKRSLEKFVLKFFNAFSENGTDFSEIDHHNFWTAIRLLKKISSSQATLALARFPLLLAMMCLLWAESEEFPQTMTGLYEEAIEYLARHCKAKEELSNSMPFKSKDSIDFNSTLTRIGCSAFKDAFQANSKSVFQEGDFESAELVHQACKLGLMFKVEKVKRLNLVTDLSFIHKTFQEFCAAKYGASLAKKNPKEFTSYIHMIDTINSAADKEYLLRFCCAFSAKAAEIIFPHVAYLSEVSLQRNYKQGYLNFYESNTWRIPYMLLLECELHSNSKEENKKGSMLLKPFVLTFTLNNILSDHELVGAIQDQYDFKNQLWPKYVLEATIYIFDIFVQCQHHNIAKLVSSMSNLTALNFLHTPTDQYYTTGFIIQRMHACSSFSTSITELNITNGWFKADDLVSFLDKQKSLSTLRLTRNKLNECDLDKILCKAKSYRLKILEVNSNEVGGAVIHIFPQLPNIHELHLFNTKMNTEHCSKLFEKMIVTGSATRLKLIKLDLGQNNLSDQLGKLAKALKYTPYLKHLGLRGIELLTNVNHFPILNHALLQLPALEVLDLQINIDDYIPSGLQDLLDFSDIKSKELIQTRIPQLFGSGSFLYPWSPAQAEKSRYIFEEEIPHCIQTVSSELFPDITRLMLEDQHELQHIKHHIKLSTIYIEALSFRKLSTLTQLNLSTCFLFGSGITKLSKSLPHMPKLTHLNLQMTYILQDGAVLLAKAWRHTPHMTSLNLNKNAIGCEGAIALAKSIHRIPNLTELYLDDNSILTNGIIALSKSFKHIPALKKLNLGTMNELLHHFQDFQETFVMSYPGILPHNVILLCNKVDTCVGLECAETFLKNISYLPKLEDLHTPCFKQIDGYKVNPLLDASFALLQPDGEQENILARVMTFEKTRLLVKLIQKTLQE